MKNIQKQFLPIQKARQIQKIGFDWNTLFFYGKIQEVRPAIVKKYGHLSDDGYYELTEDCGCGGTLKFEEVYHYKTVLVNRNDRHFYEVKERGCVPAPTYPLVGKWLYEQKKIFVNVNFKYIIEEEVFQEEVKYIKRYDKPKIIGYYYNVWCLDDVNDTPKESSLFESPEVAYNKGICEAISLLMNKK